MTVDEYVATIKPITDWSTLKEGDTIFNRTSLDVCAYDTFLEYDEQFDNVKYKNMHGQIWNGPGENYWYYSDGNFEHMKITHKMIRNGLLNGKIKLGIQEGDMVAQIEDYWFWFGCTEGGRLSFDEIVENIWAIIKDLESKDERDYYASIL